MSADDMRLTSSVSRSAAGKTLAEAPRVPIYATVSEALDEVDLLVDYTTHDVVKGHTMLALERGINVVIGTSGLTADDFEEIDALGLPHERLAIRHDADSSPDPYVEGTLLAIRRVGSRVGVTRGLDTLLLER